MISTRFPRTMMLYRSFGNQPLSCLFCETFSGRWKLHFGILACKEKMMKKKKKITSSHQFIDGSCDAKREQERSEHRSTFLDGLRCGRNENVNKYKFMHDYRIINVNFWRYFSILLHVMSRNEQSPELCGWNWFEIGWNRRDPWWMKSRLAWIRFEVLKIRIILTTDWNHWSFIAVIPNHFWSKIIGCLQTEDKSLIY